MYDTAPKSKATQIHLIVRLSEATQIKSKQILYR